MDSTSVTAISGLIIKGLELVHKRREGRLSKQEAQELYCRVFSSLLWEVHQNLKRCNGIVNKAHGGVISAGILSFFVRDSLFSDFCIMCPEPRVVSNLNTIYSAFERIHYWQRVTTDLKSENIRYIIGWAHDLFKDKQLHLKYNELLNGLKALSAEIHVPPEFEFVTAA